MENKKQQTKAPLAQNKNHQQSSSSKNAQMPNHSINNANKSPAQQKKPGSNW